MCLPNRWGIQFLGESHDGDAASLLQEDFMLAHHVDFLVWCPFFGHRGFLAGWSFSSRLRVASRLAAAPYSDETILIGVAIVAGSERRKPAVKI